MQNTQTIPLPASAAKLFKRGPYPLHPDLARVTAATLGTDGTAFSKPVEALTEDAAPVLRAMMERVLASGVNFSYMGAL